MRWEQQKTKALQWASVTFQNVPAKLKKVLMGLGKMNTIFAKATMSVDTRSVLKAAVLQLKEEKGLMFFVVNMADVHMGIAKPWPIYMVWLKTLVSIFPIVKRITVKWWRTMATEKKTKSVSLDPENKRYLDKQDNASALVNDLVQQVREGGDKSTAMIEWQLDKKRDQKRETEKKLNRIENSIEELEQMKQGFNRVEQENLEKAKKMFSNPTDPTDPAIQKWANKCGMKPDELIQHID